MNSILHKSSIKAAGTPATDLLLHMGLAGNDLLLHMDLTSNDLLLHMGLAIVLLLYMGLGTDLLLHVGLATDFLYTRALAFIGPSFTHGSGISLLLHMGLDLTITPIAAKLAPQSRRLGKQCAFHFMGAPMRLNILPSQRYPPFPELQVFSTRMHPNILVLYVVSAISHFWHYESSASNVGESIHLLRLRHLILRFFYLAFGAS